MNEDKIKHFDFAKKPHKPSFLLSLAKHLLCFGDLKKRGAQIRKHDMEALEGKPYLLLVNHASMADFSLMLPLGLLYACFGTSVTGIVIKEPWLVCMPLVGFVAAVGMLVSYALLVDDCRLYWGLWFGLSFLVMMVVPGHIINRKAKRACSGN